MKTELDFELIMLKNLLELKVQLAYIGRVKIQIQSEMSSFFAAHNSTYTPPLILLSSNSIIFITAAQV